MSLSEHITALTVAGFYYALIDDALGAETCFNTAVQLLPEYELLRAYRLVWLSVPIQYEAS